MKHTPLIIAFLLLISCNKPAPVTQAPPPPPDTLEYNTGNEPKEILTYEQEVEQEALGQFGPGKILTPWEIKGSAHFPTLDTLYKIYGQSFMVYNAQSVGVFYCKTCKGPKYPKLKITTKYTTQGNIDNDSPPAEHEIITEQPLILPNIPSEKLRHYPYFKVKKIDGIPVKK